MSNRVARVLQRFEEFDIVIDEQGPSAGCTPDELVEEVVCWRQRASDPHRRFLLPRPNLAKTVSQPAFAGDAAGSVNPGILGQKSVGANS